MKLWNLKKVWIKLKIKKILEKPQTLKTKIVKEKSPIGDERKNRKKSLSLWVKQKTWKNESLQGKLEMKLNSSK